jgi:hypothetical protein
LKALLLGRATHTVGVTAYAAPSSNDLPVLVENFRLVSPLPKEKLVEPRPVDARSLDLVAPEFFELFEA